MADLYPKIASCGPGYGKIQKLAEYLGQQEFEDFTPSYEAFCLVESRGIRESDFLRRHANAGQVSSLFCEMKSAIILLQLPDSPMALQKARKTLMSWNEMAITKNRSHLMLPITAGSGV